MTKPFVKLNELTTERGKEVTRPIVIGLAAVASIKSLKAGGCRIELNNGAKIAVTQTSDELFKALPLEDLYVEEKTEEKVSEEEANEQAAEVVDPADVAAIASANAIKLAEESGIDIADVEPNASGKIGKPEVEKFLASLDEAEEVDGGADDE